MSFTIRCSKCGYGSKVEATTTEWLCPKCGTKMIVTYTFVLVQTYHPPLILSLEDIDRIQKEIVSYTHMLVGRKRGKIGG